MLKKLFFAIILAALVYSGYWYFTASAKKSAVETWLDERNAAGWIAERNGLRVTGYPNRNDVIITDLHLANTEAGWAWTAPRFEILSLSYNPNHFIISFPPSQSVSTLGQNINIDSETMKGSIGFKLNTNLELDRTTIEIEKAKLASSDGWSSTLDKALLSIRAVESDQASYETDLNIAGLSLPSNLSSLLNPEGKLPDAFETLHTRLSADFDAPWDKNAIETMPPSLKHLDISDFTALWGELELSMKGAVDVDLEGYPTGKIEISARNWKDMIDLAQRAGALSPDEAHGAKQALSLVAVLSGDSENLKLPLTFKNKMTSLGPLPLGPAPRLVLE